MTAEKLRVVTLGTDQFLLIPIISVLTLVYGTWNVANVSIFLVSHFIHYTGMSICLHRYFSHRSFSTSRAFQFVLGFWGYLAFQGGPLFWAGTHRHHHRHCDRENDYHSPLPSTFKNFLKSHYLWLLNEEIWKKDKYRANARDFAKFRELALFDQTEAIQYGVLIPLLWLIGGWELLGFGFFLPKLTSLNCTGLINSANHLWGYSVNGLRPATCEAKNLWWTFFFQLGDNWHANHHQSPSNASNRVWHWELDPMFGIIWILERMGLIWDVRRSRRAVSHTR